MSDLTRKSFLQALAGGALAASAAEGLESAEVKKIHKHIADHKREHIAKIQEFLRPEGVAQTWASPQYNPVGAL